MRFLLALLLPLTVLAQGGLPVGNPAGAVLGIFGMCGTDPVDCGNGWCCLSGQQCTSGAKGANTGCSDATLKNSNGKGGVVVNAAYFGKMQDHQVDPGNNSTPSKTTNSNSNGNAVQSNISSGAARPAVLLLASTLLGTLAFIVPAA